MKLIVNFAIILFGLNVSAQRLATPIKSNPEKVKIAPKPQSNKVFHLNKKDSELNSSSKITNQIKVLASEIYEVKHNLKYNKIEASQISNTKLDLKEKQKIFCSLVEQIGFENADVEIREVYVESLKYVKPDEVEKILSN
jgi:hypothetical protein